MAQVGDDAGWIKVAEAVADGGLSVLVIGDPAAISSQVAAHGVVAEVASVDWRGCANRSAALIKAFGETSGEYVLIIEASAGESINNLPRYFAALFTRGADIVVGSKRHPDSVVPYPVRRRFLSAVYYAWVRVFLGLGITDTRTGVMLCRRAALEYALMRALVKTNVFALELLTIAHGNGAIITEAPVMMNEGETNFRVMGSRAIKAIITDTLAVFYRARILGYYQKCLVPKPLDHEPLVSVVIACPHRSWMLDECLAGLARQTYTNWEAIVLPDEGEGGDGEKVRFIPTGKVRPAEKRNLGIRAAKGEIVAFIDDDAYPDIRWLEQAIKYFGESSIGAVGGPGVTPPRDGGFAKLGGRVYDNWLVSGNYRYRYRAGGVRMDVEDYPSCNLFVRKSLLDKVGGYRTDFWPGEDTLLCKDIIDNWQRIIYEPWVIVYHHRRPLFLPHLRQLGRYAFHRGYFCKRYPSNSLKLAYFVPTLFVIYTLLTPLWWYLAVAVVRGHAGGAVLGGLVVLPYVFYAGLVLLTTFSIRPIAWLLTALGVVFSHFVYGIRFAQGLLAAKAPCEFIGKDHA